MSDHHGPAFHAFESRRAASQALAARLETLLAEAAAKQGDARLVVSGGTSPVDLFHALRDKPLPWSCLTVVSSDEREVPIDHPDRNEAMIAREFLCGKAAAARLVSLIPPGAIPDHFDAVVLGMGADGHTASLFPGSPDLEQALSSRNTLERIEVPQLGSYRVSLTPRALLNTAEVYLLFFGAEKRAVYEAALAGDDVLEFPVRVVLQQDQTPVSIYWAP